LRLHEYIPEFSGSLFYGVFLGDSLSFPPPISPKPPKIVVFGKFPPGEKSLFVFMK
jgi:hypothetical protein